MTALVIAATASVIAAAIGFTAGEWVGFGRARDACLDGLARGFGR